MRVLIVEDDAKTRAALRAQLQDEGLVVQGVESAEAALEELRRATPDLMLADIRLPSMSGVELVRQLSSADRLPPTIILSGEATISETVEALKLGVYDFMEKPVRRERLLQSVRNALEHKQLRREIDQLNRELDRGQEILGTSNAMERVRDLIAKVAPTEASILITGESGTGKELVAEEIHRQSPRARHALVKVNCAAIPNQLMESELFGHVRGAFTDARADKAGLFEAAHGGTLFLDEIGDMQLELQARFLRVLEDGRVRRVGETTDRAVDVRLITATNKDLSAATKTGEFREDLYFRIAHVPIPMPPLRHRKGDTQTLFDHFMARFSARYGRDLLVLTPPAKKVLSEYSWPGNVRELKNLCERLTILGESPIEVDQLQLKRSENPTGIPAVDPGGLLPLREFRQHTESEYIARVLAEANWNVAEAARVLGLQRTYLHQKMAALGIRRPVVARGAASALD